MPVGVSETPTVLAVPAEAVLTTGRRQLVYLEIEPGKYQVAEPKLGHGPVTTIQSSTV